MKDMLLPSMSMAVIRQGGRGAGDPPLTIPNREVKPRSADGTGKPGEQGAAPVEGKASEGHLRGLLFFLRHREACPLPPFLLRIGGCLSAPFRSFPPHSVSFPASLGAARRHGEASRRPRIGIARLRAVRREARGMHDADMAQP